MTICFRKSFCFHFRFKYIDNSPSPMVLSCMVQRLLRLTSLHIYANYCNVYQSKIELTRGQKCNTQIMKFKFIYYYYSFLLYKPTYHSFCFYYSHCPQICLIVCLTSIGPPMEAALEIKLLSAFLVDISFSFLQVYSFRLCAPS